MDLKEKPASGAVRRSVHGPQQADPRCSMLLCPPSSPSCALTLSSAFVSGEKNAQVSWAHSAVAALSASHLSPSSERRVPWDGHPGEATSRAGPGVRTWPGVTPGSPSPFIWIPALDFPGQAGSSQASTGRAVGRVCTCVIACVIHAPPSRAVASAACGGSFGCTAGGEVPPARWREGVHASGSSVRPTPTHLLCSYCLRGPGHSHL